MLNLSLNEDQIIQRLRNADVPAPRRDLVDRLRRANPGRPPGKLAWAVPAAAAGCLGMTIMAAALFSPAISLAAVARAQNGNPHYTIVVHRKWGQNDELEQRQVFYRDGMLWRREDSLLQQVYGLKDRTVAVMVRPPHFNFATIDEREEPGEEKFKVEEMLGPATESSVEKKYRWNGKEVIRFVASQRTKNPVTKKELLVDPKTNLPIQMTVTGLNGRGREVYEYSFTPPPAAVFEPVIPQGAKVYDYRAQRRELVAYLAKNPEGAILLDEYGDLMLLAHPRENTLMGAMAELTIEGVESSLGGRVTSNADLKRVPMGTRGVPGMLSIGNRSWLVYRFTRFNESDPYEPIQRLAKLSKDDQARAKLVTDGQAVTLTARVFKTGRARRLLKNFEFATSR